MDRRAVARHHNVAQRNGCVAVPELEESQRSAVSATQLGATIAAVFCGIVVLFIAGSVASHGALGGAVVRRSCDGTLMYSLALLPIAGFAVGASRLPLQWRSGKRLAVSVIQLITIALPIGVITAAGTPGFLGCRFGAKVAGLSGVGDSLTGAPGFVVLGASAFGLGAAVASCIGWETPAAAPANQSLVDRVLADQDAGLLPAELDDDEFEDLEELSMYEPGEISEDDEL